jgi:hypothetical protein
MFLEKIIIFHRLLPLKQSPFTEEYSLEKTVGEGEEAKTAH